MHALPDVDVQRGRDAGPEGGQLVEPVAEDQDRVVDVEQVFGLVAGLPVLQDEYFLHQVAHRVRNPDVERPAPDRKPALLGQPDGPRFVQEDVDVA